MSEENKDPSVEDTDSTVDDEAAALAAVNDAVDDITFTEEITHADDTDTDESAADAAELDTAGSEAGDDVEGTATDAGDAEESSGDEGETDGDEAADDKAAGGDEGGDDGKAVDGVGDKDEDASADGADESDIVNDPIPESVKGRTRERIQSLIETVKQKDAVVQQFDDFTAEIQKTGATPEQYANTMNVLRLYNSDTPEGKRKALEIVRSMERDLALDLGEGQAHVKLEDYPDLAAEVEAGTLSDQRALELAAVRERDKHLNTKREAQTQAENQAREADTVVQRARSAMVAVGNELAKDPAYEALYPTLTATLKPILKRVAPGDWADVTRDQFNALKAKYMETQASRPAPKRTPKPLRPKSGSSSSNKAAEANSAVDAVNAALDGM